MPPLLTSLAVLFLLVAIQGLIVLAELAIGSARKTRLRQWSQDGIPGAREALALASNPGRFLAALRIGATLFGMLAGVVGGATLAGLIAEPLEGDPTLGPYRWWIGPGVVVAILTGASLLVGDLLPRRVVRQQPERVAAWVARPIRGMAWLARPVVRPLLQLIGRASRSPAPAGGPNTKPAVTEEASELIMEGALAGILGQTEQEIVRRVIRLGDRRAYMLMTPRADIVWIDLADPPEVARRKIAGSPHTRFPVCEGTLDNILGVVQVKDLLTRGFAGQPFQLTGALTLPLLIYEGTRGLKVLEQFKKTGTHVAVVLNEYGSVEGLLTMTDLLQAIVGDLSAGDETEEPRYVRRPDGSWLFEGKLPLDEFRDQFEGTRLPRGDYQTLAGFVIARLGRIPEVGDLLEWSGFRFEVLDMVGNRIDKLAVTPPQSEARGGMADP